MTSDARAIDAIERHCSEAYAAEAGEPCAEVHIDADAAWVVHSGSAWRNSSIAVRFRDGEATNRLHTMMRRYQQHGRGMGMWISPLSTPADLGAVLHSLGLRCRRYFPAMVRLLDATSLRDDVPDGVEIRPSSAASVSRRSRTAIGRCEAERLRVRLADPAQRTRVFEASMGAKIVGRVELFVGNECSGIHGLSVDDSHQGRGIGSALLERACAEAAHAGSPSVVLLATSDGQRLYERRGFVEVAKFAYWYRSFQR